MLETSFLINLIENLDGLCQRTMLVKKILKMCNRTICKNFKFVKFSRKNIHQKKENHVWEAISDQPI